MFEKISEGIFAIGCLTALVIGMLCLAERCFEHTADLYVCYLLGVFVWCVLVYVFITSIYNSYKTERRLKDFYSSYRRN